LLQFPVTHEPNLETLAGTHDLPLHPRTEDKRDDDVVADEVMEFYETKVSARLDEQEIDDEDEVDDEEDWSAR